MACEIQTTTNFDKNGLSYRFLEFYIKIEDFEAF